MEKLSCACSQCQKPIELTVARRRALNAGRPLFCNSKCAITYRRLRIREAKNQQDTANWDEIFAKHVDPRYYDGGRHQAEWRGRFQYA
jgi:hypothetical protein